MSGFFGAVRLDGKSVDERLLVRIAERLSFRGPHGKNIWCRGNVGGCFTLMQTHAETQAAQQPVIQAERFFLWGDVRLDAQADLRTKLRRARAGAAPQTSEDLLLASWSVWGEGSLDHILGDFAFGLWDARDASLFCARDLIGARPLYYAHVDDVLYFGNTLAVFFGVPELSGELDDLFIADFLSRGCCDDPDRTAFRSIKRLPAGHILKFSRDGVRLRRFCTLPVEEPFTFANESDYIDPYLELLREAVNDRLPPGPVSLYLSGGLDSASICAIAAEVAAASGGKGTERRLKAFTLGWEPFLDDPEPEFAALTATQLRLAHEVLTDGELVAFEGASQTTWQLPEPTETYFYLRHKRQLEQIASFSSVVLGGDGGDEVLADQSWPYLSQLWREGDWTRIAQEFGGYLWSRHRFPTLGAGVRTKFGKMLHLRDKSEGYPLWLNPDFEGKLNLRDRWHQLENASTVDQHPVHPSAYRALHNGLWASVLEAEDGGWTGVALEMRAPLLDVRVLRFMLRLPTIPWCVDKEMSRRAMKTRLPEAVLRRPKAPLRIDPMIHAVLPYGWPESLRDYGRSSIEKFVNWQKWCETLREPEGSLSWRSLRPISLVLWLKAVEIRMGFE